MLARTMLRHLPRLLLILALAGCNYPGSPAEAAPTGAATSVTTAAATAAATLAPTNTSAPPPTQPLPPSETPLPTLPPPPTTVPPTPTNPPPPTPAEILPLARALFRGAFDGGDFTFRIHDNSHIVIPKTLNLRGAACS
ncbi:MAG: hypothetical protein ACKOC5_11135, partial [Chloroflexota bacterium]